MTKVPYKLASALIGALSGLLGRTIFNRAWKLATGQEV